MNDYLSSSSLYSTLSAPVVRSLAPPLVQCHTQKERFHSIANPLAAGQPQDQPASKRRRISLSDAVHGLTLAQPNDSRGEPDTADTKVAAQPVSGCHATPKCRTLKAALYNLANNDLSAADFIVLVNRYGDLPALHNFPVSTLQPSDWLAINVRACEQILQRDGSLLAQLPAQMITCYLCVAAYNCCGADMFEQVPEHLRDSFFSKVVHLCPARVTEIPAAWRTPERVLDACCVDDGLLPYLSDEDRSVDLVIKVCEMTGAGLEFIPPSQRSYALCLKACEHSAKALKYVPEELKDEELCRTALSTGGLAYRWLPAELAKTYEWQMRACLKDGAVLEWIPKEQHDEDLRLAACLSSWQALEFIDPKHITYKMCHQICARNRAMQAGQYIPKEHLDEPMRWLICSTTYDSQTCERFKPDTANFYEQLLHKNRWARLEWVPEEEQGTVHYLPACKNYGGELEHVPFEYRTPEICVAACNNDVDALQWVPERQQLTCTTSDQACQSGEQQGLGLEWFEQALHSHDQYAHFILVHAKRLLSDSDFQLLLQNSALCSNHHKIMVLAHPQVSSAHKRALLEQMLEPAPRPRPERHKGADLCEMASPLQFTLENPELKQLETTAEKVAEHWVPPRYDAGRLLLHEIEQSLASCSVGRADSHEPLFQNQGVPCGGRTLKIEQGAQAFHYKFQRKDESLQTLMREGVIHSVREKRPDLLGQLHSQLPGDSRFFKLYLDQLPETVPAFPDPPEIFRDEHGRDYLHVYRYVAPADYSVYAHTADHSGPSNPYHKGEQGILTACHDIGQFVAMGLVPTSTLPAFHNTKKGREWLALHGLFKGTDRTHHPGTFGAWSSTATEYCDFGYSGFRDVGDFEPFGHIESFMNRVDVNSDIRSPQLMQCFGLVNAVCENLVAAHLIRARLHQESSAYHYKNPKACEQAATFIEKTLLCFLKGMYGDRIKSDSDRSFLLDRLNLDKPTYERWLWSCAAQTLYWTAKQPHPDRPDRPPFEDSSPLYSHEDGYALHLNRTGQLDPQLYSSQKVNRAQTPLYPDLFHNLDGQLNLGTHNSVFPLTTLMQGLVRLCTGMLTYDHNGMGLSPDEPSQQ